MIDLGSIQHRRRRQAARGRRATLAAFGRDEEGGPESMRIVPLAGWGTIEGGRDANHEEYEEASSRPGGHESFCHAGEEDYYPPNRPRMSI
jgi:hypothetical protein